MQQKSINVGQAMPDNASQEACNLIERQGACRTGKSEGYQKILNNAPLIRAVAHLPPPRGKALLQTAKRHRGFTLIELLVVVLIIGILAAVAVPQYQKAVKKSRATEAILTLQKIAQAQTVYELANGYKTDNLNELDVDINDGFYHFRCSTGIYATNCYAEPKDGSRPVFEGDPAGSIYCRGTEQLCKQLFTVSPSVNGDSYWKIKLN